MRSGIVICRYKVSTLKEVRMVKTSIQRWGNSSAIRLPKLILRLAEMSEKDPVQITATPNEIIIRKTNRQHKTIMERLQGFDDVYVADEFDTTSVGDEKFW
jgi:antitoxin MazE